MTISYSILLLLVLGIFVFCYLVATKVWIQVDKEKKDSDNVPKNRRDFLYISSMSIGGLGVATFMWPFIKSMNPAEDTLALGSTEVDLSQIDIGQSITVKWRGKPVFIKRRTEEEILEAKNVDLNSLRDPAADEDRVQNPEWLVLEGVCTHLGCVPLGQKMSDIKGEYKGWFCPCHGSHYDLSGRIRKGPAPKNMEIPKYEFVDANTIKIG